MLFYLKLIDLVIKSINKIMILILYKDKINNKYFNDQLSNSNLNYFISYSSNYYFNSLK